LFPPMNFCGSCANAEPFGRSEAESAVAEGIVMTDPAHEVRNLKACINDLISVLALPAIWTGREPSQIISTLLDALVSILRLEFAYARMGNSSGPAPIEMVRLPHAPNLTAQPEEIGEKLKPWLTGDQPKSFRISNPIGESEVLATRLPLGSPHEVGVLVAASQRVDFPTETERLLLQVALNHAAIGLQEARRMSEQRRVTEELDQRVTQRTRELISVNEKLRKENIERKRAEESARRSEKELRAVIETIPAMVWSTLPDGTADFFNQRWQQFTGLSLERSLGWDWSASVHPEDFEQYMAKWRASIATGQPIEAEVRFRRAADGEYRWCLDNGVPLRDEQGNVLKWYGIVTDIDDRKRAEALLAGEKRILEMVARGASLAQILDNLCRLVEEEAPDVLASILLVDGDRLRHGGAPSLPKAYSEAVDGLAIGPSVGSCGTAAYRAEQVIVSDIATDPLWADYRETAARYSLRACWSTPIFSSEGNVIGTFAIYYREPHSPNQREQEIIEQITNIAGVAIQRKLGEEKLRRNETYLSEAQKISHTGSWVWSPAAGIVYWSEECYRIFGIKPEGGLPSFQSFVESIHAEDRSRFMERFDKAVREKVDFEAEYRFVHRGGDVKNIHALAHPVLSHSGDLVEFVGTAMDITERKRTEAEQRYYTQLLKTVTDNAASVLYIVDAAGIATFVNPSIERVTGYGAEELFGQIVHDKIHHTKPDGTPYPVSQCPLIGAVRMGRSVQGEDVFVRKDGTFFPVRYTANPIFRDGATVGAVIEVLDLTASKTAEHELRNQAELLNLAHDAIIVRDLESRITFWNPGAEKTYGWTAEQAIGRVSHELLQTRFPLSRRAIDVALQERGEWEGELTHVTRDGRTIVVTSRQSLRRDEHRVGVAVLEINRDITEHKRAEEIVRKTQAELAHVARVATLGELTASIAHELNQPLGALVNNASASLRWLAAKNAEEARRSIEMAIEDGHRAGEIVKRIRSFALKAPPQKDRIDVNETIGEVIALARSEAQKNSVSIQTRLGSDLPLILADRIQLQQVILNLIMNAIEAMSEISGRRRELFIASEKDGSSHVRISVGDSGPGLDRKTLSQIFTPFYTTKPQGMGMGLAICRSIIEAHGGRLWATANAHRGATFLFTLPIGSERSAMIE
jgi:PAS domain S-box-containing protein